MKPIKYAPAHSDYLVHWTGKDILKGESPNEKSYSNEIVQAFLKRLKNILCYGLWMTKHKGDDFIVVNQIKVKKPLVSRVCFTELKISDSMIHSINFGAMGIGFKRLFVVNRMGSPVYYIPECGQVGIHPFFPPFGQWYDENNIDEKFAFFKNMSSQRNDQGYIAYDLYEESEWRIICSDFLLGEMPKSKRKYFIKRESVSDSGILNDIKNATIKPDYFVPVDQWLALIIYPNLQVKNASFQDAEIRRLLNNLKSEKFDCFTEGAPITERRNFPMEIDIGAVAHF